MTASPGLQINFTGDDEQEDYSSYAAPSLAAVPAPATTVAASNTPTPVPTNSPPRGMAFEETPVARTMIKMSGQVAVNTNDDTEVTIDDRIRVVGEFRVTKVTFEQAKNGDVVRVQYVTPISDLELCPWNPLDPNDDGIVRLRGPRP